MFLLRRRDSQNVLTVSPQLTAKFHLAAGAFVLALLCLALLAGDARAATITVGDGGDTDSCVGPAATCTLRGAIGRANLDSDPDEIVFSGITAVTIENPLPLVTQPLEIQGDGVRITGSGSYATNCSSDWYVFTATASLARTGLPVSGVCGQVSLSSLVAPSIQVGPRRADNTVAISGQSAAGTVEIYRADSVVSGEASATYKDSVTSSGSYSYVPGTEPSPGESFAATVTAGGTTSTFSPKATTPTDLTSPILQRAVAISNNTVRVDFNESISFAVTTVPGAFSLSVGGLARPVTNVGVNGASVYLTSLTSPWGTGEAGTLGFTGNGRVIDVAGNELLGQPTTTVLAGPGETTAPTITKMRANPTKFCQVKTKKCSKRGQTYLYFNLSKPSRVVFTIMRAKGRKFVARYVFRLEKGQIKSRLRGTMNGRKLPATNLIVQAVAEDTARNLSVPAEAKFKVVTRNKQL